MAAGTGTTRWPDHANSGSGRMASSVRTCGGLKCAKRQNWRRTGQNQTIKFPPDLENFHRSCVSSPSGYVHRLGFGRFLIFSVVEVSRTLAFRHRVLVGPVLHSFFEGSETIKKAQMHTIQLNLGVTAVRTGLPIRSPGMCTAI